MTSRSWRRTIIWSAISLVTVSAFIYWRVQAGRVVYEKPGFRFTSASCGGLAEFGQSNSIKSHSWRTDGALLIEGAVIATCGAGPTEGEYVVSGNNIFLTYGRSSPPEAMAACRCAYPVTYEIAGLSRAEYQMILSSRGNHGAAPKSSDIGRPVIEQQTPK